MTERHRHDEGCSRFRQARWSRHLQVAAPVSVPVALLVMAPMAVPVALLMMTRMTFPVAFLVMTRMAFPVAFLMMAPVMIPVVLPERQILCRVFRCSPAKPVDCPRKL